MIDAPLAETAIVGACTGAAIAGMRPVAEMQFADFVSCAWDHLVTVAAKQHYRTGIRVPIVVRLPSGGGFSGGPFHSQNPESSFAHVPGLKIACPSTPADAKGLLLAALDDPNPVLYFEHKHLYRRLKGEVPEGREPDRARPRAGAPPGRRRDGRDLGRDGAHGATDAAERLAAEDGVEVEVLDLRTILPWDREAVLESVRRTSRAARPARGHAHGRLRRGDRRHRRRRGVQRPRRPGAPPRRRPTRPSRSRRPWSGASCPGRRRRRPRCGS